MAVVELHESPPLAPLFVRAALTAKHRSGRLPDTEVRRTGVRVDREHLTAYQRVCGFDVSDVLPHTYPHVLGFPLQVTLMAGLDFPLPLPGLVHLRNEITVHRRLTADDQLDLRVHAQALRPHRKGTLVDLVTEVDSVGERVWEGRSTYLRRGPRAETAPSEPTAPGLPDRAPAAVIRVPGNQGRVYAGVSGDVNPIHLLHLAARAMGFPRAIAHGMWSAARVLAQLGPGAAGPSRSQVWFGKPVLLPTTVELVVDPDATPLAAGLRSQSRPEAVHLTLTLNRVPAST